MTNQLLENEKLGALTLEDLVFFVTLCEELSLSETAKRCSLSLSGASRTMKKLREVFDDKLFLRSMPDSIATERSGALSLGERHRGKGRGAYALCRV